MNLLLSFYVLRLWPIVCCDGLLCALATELNPWPFNISTGDLAVGDPGKWAICHYEAVHRSDFL